MPTKALLALGLAAVLFAVLHAPGAAAYPIPPRTLMTQVESSELVAFVSVERVRPIKRDPDSDSWADSVAHLRVEKVLKGKAGAKLEIPYSAGMLCPAPARFEEGKLALVFLNKDKKGDWAPNGLSYATLYPHPDELAAFTDAVVRADKLLKKNANEEELRAFFVDLAVDPATRWHGLYELQRGAFLMARYDRERQKVRALDDEELHRLTEAFISSPRSNTVELLRALEAVDDERVDATAAKLAREMLSESASFRSHQLLFVLAERQGFERPRPAYGEDEEEILGDPLLRSMRWDDLKSQKKLLAAVMKRVDLKKVGDLPAPRASRVKGVGGETPP